MQIIIIEDEPRTARELKSILSSIEGDLEVVAILPSVASAIRWFKENPAPELIFSDIQLSDGLSFEIFKEMQTSAPVIFCTAFDQYVLSAFESNSIDYLLKPIEEAMVERSLRKFRQIKDHYSETIIQSANLNKAIRHIEGGYKQSLLVHFREKMIPVRVDRICYIHASNGLVTIHVEDNSDYVVRYTIEQLEATLNPGLFFKANRQFIVNRAAIQNIEAYFNRRLLVRLKCMTPDKIIVSRLKAQDFLRWIEQ